MKNKVVNAFMQVYGERPAWVVRAPGRVNLIGEHTDYNDGFVFPMAINRAVWIAMRPRHDGRLDVQSLDFGNRFQMDLEDFSRGAPDWVEYVKGTAWALQDYGAQLTGWEGVLAGDISIGSGLSSSAALEIGVARTFSLSSGLAWDPLAMAKITQKAENQWVGVNCGIMDQLISAVAEEGRATLIDCQSLKVEQVLLPEEVTVVVMNTKVRRGLVDSAYNERRSQCEAAAAHFGKTVLRDVGIEELIAARGELGELIYKRAHHVITENERTLRMAHSLRHNDLGGAGELMVQSHKSLRDDFEVSCPELDLMVEAAMAHPGCLGARMTGAGFGGCAVALVREDRVHDFSRQASAAYRSQTGIDPEFLVTTPAQGVQAEPIAT